MCKIARYLGHIRLLSYNKNFQSDGLELHRKKHNYCPKGSSLSNLEIYYKVEQEFLVRTITEHHRFRNLRLETQEQNGFTLREKSACRMPETEGFKVEKTSVHILILPFTDCVVLVMSLNNLSLSFFVCKKKLYLHCMLLEMLEYCM